MKILIINANSPLKWAGLLSKSYLEIFTQKGHNVKLITKDFIDTDDSRIVSYNSKMNYLFSIYIERNIKRIRNHLFYKKSKIKNNIINSNIYNIQTIDQVASLISSKRLLKRIGFIPDSIFIIMTQHFVNYQDLYNIYNETKAPIYINLFDMSPFTGICHYSWNCENYKGSCENCPAHSSPIVQNNLQSKIEYISKIDISAFGVSYWITDKAKQSTVFKDKEIIKIPSANYLPDFNPLQSEAKRQLKTKYGIKTDSFVISFSAVALWDKRKGVDDIIKALNAIRELLNSKNVTIIVSGKGQLPIVSNSDRLIMLGLFSRNELRQFYQVSDVYVSASKQDVGPGTIIEAIHCGVPVISYDVGCAEEWVINNKTGYLTKENSVDQLIKGLTYFIELNSVTLKEYSKNCLNLAHEKKFEVTVDMVLQNMISKHENS